MNTTSTAVRIAFDDVGDGEPAFLFLPGWCANRTVFRWLLEPTGRHRRALALDWRGHGGSERIEDDYTTGDLVEDAESVIEASGVGAVVPVGLSHGGWVAVELRRRLGAARVPAVVFIDWMFPEVSPPFLDTLSELRDRDRWEAVRGELSPCPTLHVYAQPRDEDVLGLQEAYARRHPWFRVHRLDARTHFPMFEIPEALAAVIEEFAVGVAAATNAGVRRG